MRTRSLPFSLRRNSAICSNSGLPSPPAEAPPLPGVPPTLELALLAFALALGDTVAEVAENGRLNAPVVDGTPNGVRMAAAAAAEAGLGLPLFLAFALALKFACTVVDPFVAADGVLVAEFDVGLRAALNGDADISAAWKSW